MIASAPTSLLATMYICYKKGVRTRQVQRVDRVRSNNHLCDGVDALSTDAVVR